MTHRRSFLVILPLVAVAAACRPAELAGPADPDSLRRVEQGELVGLAHPEVEAHAWLGIPFARPPLGELRWRAPLAPEPWPGTREALRFGPSCPQPAGPVGARDGAAAGEPTGSEDCLYLNVYAPRFAPGAVPAGDERLPVMVWIHGGGNTIGDAVLYDGSWLATDGDVVVVTVHYRLGLLGWLSHPALRGEGTSAEDRSGNFGTLDLVRALEWVERNAQAFGGDPRNVTVFGESAGGANVVSLLLSPRASGLFQRAIVQSGGVATVPRAEAEGWSDDAPPGHPSSSRELAARLLVAEGRAADREEARRALDAMPGAELAAWLRSKSPAELLAAVEGDRLGGMYDVPRLIRDGLVLPDAEPMAAFAAGSYNRVPAIFGSNLHENRLFALFASEHLSRVFGLPVRMRDLRKYQLEADYASLMWKARGVDEPAAALAAVQGPSVFAYRFDWDDEPRLLWLDLSELLGAAHGLEIPFVFGRLRFFGRGWPIFSPGRSEQDMALARAMGSYWTQFARTGDPGRGRDGALPEWQAWDAAGDGHFLVLDSEDDAGIRMDGDAVTREEVIRRIGQDGRFAFPGERCRVYAEFVRWGTAMPREDYDTIHEGRCRAQHPLED